MPTVGELVAEGRLRLAESPHPDRAGLDAETLLLQILRRNRAWLLTHGEKKIEPDKSERYFAFVERRFRGEPLQYIFRQVEFYGITLAILPRVLIPRPETEHLVEKAIQLAYCFPSPRILEVGTGSGAIAIAVAHDTLTTTGITATDISSAALKVARFNARRSGFFSRIRFLQGDLLEPVKGESFEIILSNPPYVPTTDRDSLAVEVRDHEPGLALFGGEDGLCIYRRLIPAAFATLVPGGFVLLEIGQGQSEAVGGLLKDSGFQQIEFVPDLQGIQRVACGRRP